MQIDFITKDDEMSVRTSKIEEGTYLILYKNINFRTRLQFIITWAK